MTKQIIFSLLFAIGVWFSFNAQNQPVLIFGSNYGAITTDKYERATQKINLKPDPNSTNPGFKFNANQSPNNLLNLSISTYSASLVNSNYVDPTLQPFTGFDSNKAFSQNDGVYDVTQDGQFTYDLPIIVSPGTSGIQPNISISYNSFGVNTTMGVGFSLKGISCISRTNRTIFEDKKNAPIDLSANGDVFSLDGNRLVSVTGTYGGPNATYKTLNENYTDLTSIGNTNNGPDYFTATDNAGNVFEYGNGNNSKYVGVGDNTALSWYISRVTDEFGNYMQFFYKNTGGEILIDRIEYTGNSNSNLLPYNKVQFEYMERSDKNTFYISGKSFNNTKLLKSISSYDIDKNLVHKYYFDYQFSIYSLLNKITEVDSKQNELNPIVFQWGKPESYIPGKLGACSTIGAAAKTDLRNVIGADLNGDGYSDLCAYYSGSNAEIKSDFNNMYSFPQYAANNPQITFLQPPGFYPGGNPVNQNSILLSMSKGDYDDNGAEEVYAITCDLTSFVVIANTAVYDKKKYHIIQYLYDPVADAFTGTDIIDINQTNDIDLSNYDETQTTFATGFHSNPKPFSVDFIDLTGDGIKDILINDQEKLRVIVRNSKFAVTGTTITFNSGIYSNVRIGDINGDGKEEIFLFKAVNAGLYTLDVLSFNPQSNTFSAIVSNMQLPMLSTMGLLHFNSIDLGDYNGDGRTDLSHAVYGNFNKKLNVFYSTGMGYSSTPDIVVPVQSNVSTNLQDWMIYSKDVNSDGKSEIIFRDFTNHVNNVPTDYYQYLIYFNGKNYINGNLSPLTAYGNLTTYGDFNADGLIDEYSTATTASLDYLDFSYENNTKIAFLKKIISPKNEIDLKYNYLRGNGAFETSDVFKYYENDLNIVVGSGIGVINAPPSYVVTSLKDNLNDFRFSYKNANHDFVDNSFLGFQEVNKIELNTMLASKISYTFDNAIHKITNFESIGGKGNIYLAPFGNIQMKYFDINTGLISFKSLNKNTYTQPNSNSSYNFLTQTKVQSYDYLKSSNNRTTTNFDVNQKGSVTSQLEESHVWGTNNLVRSTATNFQYQFFNGYYKTKNVKSTFTQASETPYSREISYLFDAAGHIVSMIQDVTNTFSAVTTNYSQFNVFGRSTNVSVSAPDIQSRTSSLLYDVTGRFVVKKTNAINDVEEFVYSPTFGSLIESKDINGLVSTFKYDGQGRLIESILPNNAVNKVKYQWNSNGPFDGSHIVTTNNEGDSPKTQTFDKNSHLVKTELIGLNGNPIVSENTYNNLGQIIKTTSAHYSNQSTFPFFQYNYEQNFFRRQKEECLIETSSNSNSKYRIIYEYNQPSDDNIYNIGYVKTTKRNAQNILVDEVTHKNNEALQETFVTNFGNSTQESVSEYKYLSHGNPKSIDVAFPDGGVNLTTFAYDDFGNQKSIIDQSAGTTSYTYNSIGELIREENGNGDYSFQYDLIGRLITKTGSNSGIFSYQYATSNDGREKIEKIIGPNNMTEFKYDYLGRMVEQKETIDSKIFKSSYTYNKFGKVNSYTYPNGFILNYFYDGSGILTDIKNSNLTIWHLSNEFLPGIPDQYVFGNGITTNCVFDNYAQLKEINTGAVYKQEYDFNPGNGNLLERKSSNFNLNYANNEKFLYDSRQRLSQVYNLVNNAVVINQTINYKDNGNINQKSDAGDYIYSNASQPYKLQYIDNPTNNISTNQLDLSYNDLRKVKKIAEANSNKEMNFIYGNDNERIKMDYKIGSANQYLRYYTSNFDRQESGSNFKEWCYVKAPSGLCAVYFNNNGNGNLYYITTDHVGSPILLTNSNGAVTEEYNFDAWGRRRNPTDWTYNLASTTPILNRGFTFHEHIDEFALINMNGRVYDPVLGRFVQPDVMVQTPDNLQNFNRFNYAFNNPLKYTDPSGNNALVAGMALAVLMDAVVQVDRIQTGQQSKFDFNESLSVGLASAVGMAFSEFSPTYYGTSLAGRYTQQTLYSGVTAGVSYLTQQIIYDLLTNNQKSSEEYFKGAGKAALIGMGITAVSLAHSYATWDRYSPQEKVDMLSKEYGVEVYYDEKLMEKGWAAVTDPNTNCITFGPDGLQTRAYARVTMEHELQHYQDFAMSNCNFEPKAPLDPEPTGVYSRLEGRNYTVMWDKLQGETNAHLYDMSISNAENLQYRHYRTSARVLYNGYGYMGPNLSKPTLKMYILNLIK